jgi:cytochrome P450
MGKIKTTSKESPGQIDLYHGDYLEDPASVLRQLRKDDPVHFSKHGFWFVTKYDDVKLVLRD